MNYTLHQLKVFLKVSKTRSITKAAEELNLSQPAVSIQLKNSNIVIIEVYNFIIADKSIRFWEMCAYMDKLGFLPIDLVDVLHRKKDNSLWQFDLIFIKKDRKEFSFTTYE